MIKSVTRISTAISMQPSKNQRAGSMPEAIATAGAVSASIASAAGADLSAKLSVAARLTSSGLSQMIDEMMIAMSDAGRMLMSFSFIPQVLFGAMMISL